MEIIILGLVGLLVVCLIIIKDLKDSVKHWKNSYFNMSDWMCDLKRELKITNKRLGIVNKEDEPNIFIEGEINLKTGEIKDKIK